MRWLELSFATSHAAAELLTDYLTSLGAAGVQVKDSTEIRALLERPDSLAYADEIFWQEQDETVTIKAYFPAEDDQVRCNRDPDAAVWSLYDNSEKHYLPLDRLEEMIRKKLADFARYLEMGEGYLGWSEVREDDWAENWKKYYQTLHLTKRIVINPSWLDYEPQAGELVIKLDPGSAFGTGTHETTALCVRLLDELVQPGARVLDLGTGSGILAIVAAKLGAGYVEALDIDDLAISAARQNIRQNEVDVRLHQGELDSAVLAEYDLIVANIIADVIIDLLPQTPALLARQGLLLLSGIIEDKLPAVKKAAQDLGLLLLRQEKDQDWYALLYKGQE